MTSHSLGNAIMRQKCCSLIILIVLVNIGLTKWAQAASLRCQDAPVGVLAPMPPATIGVTVPEAPEINALWRDLGDPTNESDGNPLGCPVDAATDGVSDDFPGWQGVKQRFQRGSILIGRHTFTGVEIAAIRGLGGWTVWWKGPPQKGLGDLLLPSMTRPEAKGITSAPAAAWVHGGNVLTSAASDTVALWRCRTAPCVIQGGSAWERITPLMDGQSRPFDAAEALGSTVLSAPDISVRAARHDAIFASWLPCFTRLALDGSAPGEDSIARPTVMMRKADACRLTGKVPRADAASFLATLNFPNDQLPGTSSDDSMCPRKGDLDVTLVQLLHLIFEHHADLDVPTLNHLRDILAPWGGSPRPGPYITPDGTCLGFGVIETENHILLQESARYLINTLLNERQPTDTTANRDWLVRFMQQLVRRDMYEFNALPYTRYQLKALFLLHDYAPDARVAASARGVLDWLFTKQALARNLDRDHRPFRRRPEAKLYAEADWWSHASTATTTEGALLIGPLEHVHRDVDLDVNPEGQIALKDTFSFPELGTASDNFLAEFTDVLDTKYVLPPALIGWFESRFTDETANRATYVQGINHTSPIADDQALFRQANSGAELVSGNRNWTMIGGGTAAPPGDPGPPPEGTAAEAGYIVFGAAGGAIAGAVVGGVLVGLQGAAIGAVIGLIGGLFAGALAPQAIAANKQNDVLWHDQAGIMRETILIPTPVGLDRAQTIRFGAPTVLAAGQDPPPRLCVAEGFMCGFDLEMPSHPFPARDQSHCPLAALLPSALNKFITIDDEQGKPIIFQFGCLVQKPAEDMRGWSIWTFEHAMLAMANKDTPGQERVAALWVEDDTKGRKVKMKLLLPNQQHDWYNFDVYNTAVATSAGDPPGGGILYTNSGDVDDLKTWNTGDASFSLKDVTDRSWYFIASACDPKRGLFGIRTGHECHADILPKLSVSVDIPPKQPFSCRAHSFRDGSFVLEVGSSCSDSPYGMFVYIWTAPCTGRCPDFADEYGFVVVAPSRGWSWQDFAAMVEKSISDFESKSHPYLPIGVNSVTVPISPPVRNFSSDPKVPVWRATDVASSHVVGFRWVGDGTGQSQIVGDTGAPLTYGPLSGDWTKWPTAVGHVHAPDVAATGELLHSNGAGCFSLAGLPTAAEPNPVGLLIDLRDLKAPKVVDARTSTLLASCP